MNGTKKWAAGIGAIVLGVVMTGLVPIAASASVVDPPDDGKCYEWVATTYKTIDNPNYVPAVPGTPGTPAVPGVDATYDHWTDLDWLNYNGSGPIPGEDPLPSLDDPAWHNPAGTPNGQHAFSEHTPNVPYSVSNGSSGNYDWFLWKATFVPGTPAIPGIPAVPATPGTPAVGTPTIEVVDVAGHNVEVACPPSDDDDDYVTVAWRMPSWTGDGATWPQTYQDHQGTEEPELNVLDQVLPDGCYQIDVYYDDQTTTDLIAGGHLDGPNSPPEHLISGGEGEAWKFLKIGEGECNPVDEPDVASASWTGTVPTCLDLDGSGEFAFENASVTSAFRAGDDVDYAGGFHAGTHDAPFDGVWTVTLTANEGAVFAGGSTTKVLEFTIDRLTAEECVVTPPPACSATEDTSHWQRYSWVGGPIPEGVTPEFLGADDPNWQANTASDPHKIGVAGAYDRGKPGNADWFYLEWVDQPPCPTATGVPFSVTPEPASCTAAGTFDASSLGGVYNEETGRWEFENVNAEVIFGEGDVTINVFAHEGFVIELTPEQIENGWFLEEGGARASITIELDDILVNDPETGLPCQFAVVTLEPPFVVDVCGTANDYVLTPDDTDAVTYRWQDEDDLSNLNVEAIVAAGNTVGEVPEGWVEIDTNAYLYEVPPFTNVACGTDEEPPPPVTPPAPPSLSFTGFDGMGGVYGSAALLLAGTALLITRRFVRR